MDKDFNWQVSFQLPDWVDGYITDSQFPLTSSEAQMDWVIGLAHEHIRRKTGGPFAAAVFTQAGELVAPGVNLVTTADLSSAHAEVVALSMAQTRLHHFDLSTQGQLTLVTSTEPCAMCLGSIVWSGITKVVAGARGEDAEAIGFDEGPKPADWVKALTDRGIAVEQEVLQQKAAGVLRAYAGEGGEIYNSRS